MAKKSIPPSAKEQAFDCPHCGAYTTQYWYDLLCDKRKDNIPPAVNTDEIRGLIKKTKISPKKKKQNFLKGLITLIQD
jgi:hypothetical protein